MNIGLLYTPVSIFQMTRGALVLFVGILSVLFLHRRLHLYQWLALIVVMGGVAVVGLSGSLVKNAVREPDPTKLTSFEDGPPPETSVLIGAFSCSSALFLLPFLSRSIPGLRSPRLAVSKNIGLCSLSLHAYDVFMSSLLRRRLTAVMRGVA